MSKDKETWTPIEQKAADLYEAHAQAALIEEAGQAAIRDGKSEVGKAYVQENKSQTNIAVLGETALSPLENNELETDLFMAEHGDDLHAAANFENWQRDEANKNSTQIKVKAEQTGSVSVPVHTPDLK